MAKAAGTKQQRIKHGLAGDKHGDPRRHPLYARWINMRQRCRNPKHPRYKDWGGRGIEFSTAWDDFRIFLRDMLALPNAMQLGYSVDRIQNDGNYEPGNVQWATASQQRRNQRSTVWPFGYTEEERDRLNGFDQWAEEQQLREELAAQIEQEQQRIYDAVEAAAM